MTTPKRLLSPREGWQTERATGSEKVEVDGRRGESEEGQQGSEAQMEEIEKVVVNPKSEVEVQCNL